MNKENIEEYAFPPAPRLRWGRGAGGKAVKAIGGDYRDYSVG